jgi:hypothetical protein
VFLYVLGGALILWAGTVSPVRTPYMALVGVLLIGGGLTMTTSMRLKPESERGVGFPFFLLTLVSGFTAAHYASPMIGYVSAISLMATLGFAVLVGPLVYVIGFEDDAALGRATISAFAIVAAYVAMTAFGWVNPTIEVFRDGMLFMGCMVGYIGLLIASSRWYRSKAFGYVGMQVVTIAAGALAITLGPVLGIPELTKIGGTFFVLYIVEKFCEIPMKSLTAYAGLGAFLCFLAYQGLMIVMENPATYAPYLIGM